MKLSKYQELVANDSSPKAPRGKGNKQHKDPKKHEKGDESPSQHNIESKFSSRKETSKSKRDEFSYWKKLGHHEHTCFLNNIGELTHIPQKNNTQFPSSVSSPSS